ncbi:MAG: hypothetical protein WA840_01600 [Caulobacteraceae bacterium]
MRLPHSMTGARRWLFRAMAGMGAAAAAVALCGFVTLPLTPAQQAMVNHYTNNDPAWTILRDARIDEDVAKGVLNAAFGPKLEALDGKPFRISGYMTPLETSMRTRRFVVTRRDTTCPFCPPNEPTEAVEVRLDASTTFTHEEVAVSGRLELVGSSDKGLFYRLTGASMVPDRSQGRTGF